MNTLLLTACIQPSGSTPGKSSDQLFLETREAQYIKATRYYIEVSDFTHIVLCDNTNYSFFSVERDVVRDIATKQHKQIELLSFDGNKKSHIYGYGYGEAEILDYAYDHSKILQNSSSRYKITGRYIVKDINTILTQLKDHACFFQKQGLLMSPFTVSTAFFKVSNTIYQQYLYQRQTTLLEKLHNTSYKYIYFIQDHFPLERAWYCLLYYYLIDVYYNITSIKIIYTFPQTNTHGISESLRDSIYRLYCDRGISQFGWIHRFIHRLCFKKHYREAIDDNLF